VGLGFSGGGGSVARFAATVAAAADGEYGGGAEAMNWVGTFQNRRERAEGWRLFDKRAARRGSS
jgi:hypothetical protein